MAGSTFGTIYKVHTFGESHGNAIGGVVDGVPANVELDLELIQHELDRRKPGQSAIVTQRKESDKVKFLSGIFEGKTTGSPIGFTIPNGDQRPGDYETYKDVFRPSHADFTYSKKYGHRDHRGGGRSSARETACRVVAGAIAKQILSAQGITFQAYVDQVGPIKLTEDEILTADFLTTELNPVRCPHPRKAEEMEALIRQIRKEGDTIGGCVRCEIYNVPPGLGEPVFDKLHAELGKAMLSINAAKGFEYGSGFAGAEMKGSDHNDTWIEGEKTLTNFSGGIQGGISNGMPIYFRVAFKPVATIILPQETMDIESNMVTLTGQGRHDPCVVPRAVPIVEAMAAMVILDFHMRHNSTR
jgi:chorismate synthase